MAAARLFIESNVRPQSWVLPGVPCPLDDAQLRYGKHLRCQHQLMDPSRLLPKICKNEVLAYKAQNEYPPIVSLGT